MQTPKQETIRKTEKKKKKGIGQTNYAPALAANAFNPSWSATANSRSINAPRSPALSKASRARSNRHTVSARSPRAFHLTSDSFSGTVRAISVAVSRSSSERARSNLWSESVVIRSASSFRSVLRFLLFRMEKTLEKVIYNSHLVPRGI